MAQVCGRARGFPFCREGGGGGVNDVTTYSGGGVGGGVNDVTTYSGGGGGGMNDVTTYPVHDACAGSLA